MTELTYTSIYQMNYLLIEAIHGNIANSIVKDSFQVYIIDLNTAITENKTEVLEPVRDCIEGYFDPIINDDAEITSFINALDTTLKNFGLDDSTEICPFFKIELEKILNND